MKILVISDSVVVNKLLSLSFDKNGIDSEIVSDVDDASSRDYSIVFIDDILRDLSQTLTKVKKELFFSKLVLISNKKELEALCDFLLSKPFQSSDVQKLLDSIDLNDDLVFDDEDEIDDFEDEEEIFDDDSLDDEEDSDLEEINKIINKQDDNKTNILDPDEIERIKALMVLEADEDDILSDDVSFVDKLKSKEGFKLKTKDSKRFLKELIRLNKSELKRLLKGAKIRIRVEYE